ncbi:hypothetical protein Rhopal_001003-T1 [Rhodotorula paludigena]|uniref:Uncharacterized protein n=1 Tax=Rhodotorula paludigena TaxID=86838 RepID=A0AAV5GFC2_9BASI|nr:hypothetical protein Rhopal_001003-T1 [Rhodotorula paludigena]
MARLQFHDQMRVADLTEPQLNALSALLSAPAAAPRPSTPLRSFSLSTPSSSAPAASASSSSDLTPRDPPALSADPLPNLVLEEDLRRARRADIAHHRTVGTLRGRQHAMGLPVRGQRNRTNGKTAKKLNRIERRGFASLSAAQQAAGATGSASPSRSVVLDSLRTLHAASGPDAILFYGVCVMAADLIFAARAWTEIEPALRAIELIQARRRRGALQTTGAERVADVPDEIWDMALRELATDSAQEEEYAFVDSVHYCGECTCSCEPLHPPAGIEHFSVCARCGSSVFDSGGITGHFDEDLELASEHAQIPEDSGAESELASLACLSFQPSAARSKPAPEASIELSHGMNSWEDRHDLVRLWPESFDVPFDTTSRFHQFLRLFDLRTYDPIRSESSREKMPAKKRGDKDTATDVGPHALSRGSGTPGWYLWVCGDSCV